MFFLASDAVAALSVELPVALLEGLVVELEAAAVLLEGVGIGLEVAGALAGAWLPLNGSVPVCDGIGRVALSDINSALASTVSVA